jgi:hypothetical protein
MTGWRVGWLGGPTAMIDGHSIDATAQTDVCGSDGPTLQVFDSYAVEVSVSDAQDWLDTYHYGEYDNADDYDKVRDYSNQWANEYTYVDKENDFNSWDAATTGFGLMIGAAGMVSSSVAFPYIGLTLSAVSFLDALELFGTRHVEEKTDTSYSISRSTGFSGEKAVAVHYVDYVVDVPKGESLEVDVDHEFNYRDDPCTGDIDDKIRDGFCYTLHVRENPETYEPYAKQCGRL